MRGVGQFYRGVVNARSFTTFYSDNTAIASAIEAVGGYFIRGGNSSIALAIATSNFLCGVMEVVINATITISSNEVSRDSVLRVLGARHHRTTKVATPPRKLFLRGIFCWNSGVPSCEEGREKHFSSPPGTSGDQVTGGGGMGKVGLSRRLRDSSAGGEKLELLGKGGTRVEEH